MHLGFPSGDQLRNRLITQLKKTIASSDYTQILLSQMPNLLDTNDNLILQSCERLMHSLRYTPSVDNCLAQIHKSESTEEKNDESADKIKREGIQKAIIKTLIVQEIVEHQRNKMDKEIAKIQAYHALDKAEKQREKARSEKAVGYFDEPPHNWYQNLWFHLNENLKTPSPEVFWASNDVNFITFNYDTSLELFLYDAYNRTYESSAKDSKTFKEEVNKRVHHVYGQITDIKIEAVRDLYRTKDEIEHITKVRLFNGHFEIRNNIKTFGESTFDVSRAHVMLENARVFILGSSLNHENMSLLFDPSKKQNKIPLEVISIGGTHLGISEYSLERVRSYIFKWLKPNLTEAYNSNIPKTLLDELISFENTDCSGFMESYKYIISYGIPQA